MYLFLRRKTWRDHAVGVAHVTRLGVEFALGIAAAIALLVPFSSPNQDSTAGASRPDAVADVAVELAGLEHDAMESLLAPALAARTSATDSLRRGDTLAGLLERAGVVREDLNAAVYALNSVYSARDLRAGQDFQLYLQTAADDSVRLAGLAMQPDATRTIEVMRASDGGYVARDVATPLTRRVAKATGSITESLYADAIRAGAHDRTIAEIASLLAYSVDFQREIRPGDEFEIVFEQFIGPDGKVAKVGELYFVRFTPKGRELAYWRYDPSDDEPGYYDAKGESAKRFLMRTPVNATRISSGFSRARKHPVLGYTRAHKGTDFAAPRGTPIYAAGNGVVERANRYGSFGNYVRIRHANGYKTIYGHLNGFARGVRAGTRVTQGRVIGYVGMTGTATGPHLHYEVHLNGTAVNPMTIEAPTGRTLTAEDMPEFDVERAFIDALRARAVDAAAPAPPGGPTLVADGDPEPETRG
jgi:murein DD-endopeptidase MepM/ murein hydrolase activator NlpD